MLGALFTFPFLANAATTTNTQATSLAEIISPLDDSKKVALDDLTPHVPFYSQFTDIQSAKWKKRACGVTSLAMMIEYYKPGSVSVNKLLEQGIASGAYSKAGWTHRGLIKLGEKYGLEGDAYDLSKSSTKKAFEKFTDELEDGPVITSVHYKFNPKSTIPHLVVINGIKGGMVYYNDPAAKSGEKQISVADFQKAWKKKFIVIRPVGKGDVIAMSTSSHTSPLLH